MEKSTNNPQSNQLGPGLTEAQVLDAVERSGYPLQTFVASVLQDRFSLQEEWSFVDKDSGDLRSLDIHANYSLYNSRSKTRVRPQLDLLIECKQSELPYMFFVADRRATSIPEFPRIGGLRQESITITTDDDPSSWSFDIVTALGLGLHPFQSEPLFCHTFSKCVRKGKDVELSGSEAYNGLVLPLIKAVQHFVFSERPGETVEYFDAHLVLGIGVLDAPMVAVEVKNGTPELTMVPWVRLLRHEYSDHGGWWERNKMRVIDIIHKDFVADYIDQHVLPFARQFGELAVKHNEELATGEAFASGMGSNSSSDVEDRLHPLSGDRLWRRSGI